MFVKYYIKSILMVNLGLFSFIFVLFKHKSYIKRMLRGN